MEWPKELLQSLPVIMALQIQGGLISNSAAPWNSIMLNFLVCCCSWTSKAPTDISSDLHTSSAEKHQPPLLIFTRDVWHYSRLKNIAPTTRHWKYYCFFAQLICSFIFLCLKKKKNFNSVYLGRKENNFILPQSWNAFGFSMWLAATHKTNKVRQHFDLA